MNYFKSVVSCIVITKEIPGCAFWLIPTVSIQYPEVDREEYNDQGNTRKYAKDAGSPKRVGLLSGESWWNPGSLGLASIPSCIRVVCCFLIGPSSVCEARPCSRPGSMHLVFLIVHLGIHLSELLFLLYFAVTPSRQFVVKFVWIWMDVSTSIGTCNNREKIMDISAWHNSFGQVANLCIARYKSYFWSISSIRFSGNSLFWINQCWWFVIESANF